METDYAHLTDAYFGSIKTTTTIDMRRHVRWPVVTKPDRLVSFGYSGYT